MFDQEFFQTTLGKHVSEKTTFSDDGVTVRLRLSTGETMTVVRVVEATRGCVIVEMYPQKGKLRQYSKAQRDAGAPLSDFDRVALAYGVITDVLITGRVPKNQAMGFRTA